MTSGIWDTDLQNSPYTVQGNWNASTNTPDLTFVTTLGYAWIVSVPGSFNLGGKIAAHVKARLRRITSTGTAPSANPFCEMLQLHIEQDTTGSRLITTK